MRYAFGVRVGPVGFRVGSDWAAPIAALRDLYRGYPALPDGIADLTVRLRAGRPWRRWIRPAVHIHGDFMLPEAAPLPLAQGLLAAEMSMNLQLALGWRRHLLLHAATLDRDGRALILTGESGSGKSTLSALLGRRGWRFMGDEFALLDMIDGSLHPFPRPISVKNAAIAVVAAHCPDLRRGPLLTGTPKGTIRHFVPEPAAVAAMDQASPAALILFPTFGRPAATRPMQPSETFVRLTQASTNYVALGEAGFTALSRLVTAVPAHAIDFPDASAAEALIERLWKDRA